MTEPDSAPMSEHELAQAARVAQCVGDHALHGSVPGELLVELIQSQQALLREVARLRELPERAG